MPLQLGNFVGFETGGLEESSYTISTPEAHTAFPRSGRYCLKLNLNTDRYTIQAFAGGLSNQGNDHIMGVALRVGGTNAISNDTIRAAESNSGAVCWWLEVLEVTADSTYRLRLLDSDKVLIDDSSSIFNCGQWYYIEVAWQYSATGSIDLYVDDASEISSASENLTGGGTLNQGVYSLKSEEGEDHYFDDFYCYSGSSGVSDFLGSGTHVMGPYVNTLAGATDQGTTLATGTWGDTGEVPFSDTNYAEYTGNDDQGHCMMNQPPGDGPYTDNDHTTFYGAKFIQRRTHSGTKAPVYLRYGYFISPTHYMTNVAVTPLKTWVNYFQIMETSLGSSVAYACFGMDNGGTNNNSSVSAQHITLLVTADDLTSLSEVMVELPASFMGPHSV